MWWIAAIILLLVALFCYQLFGPNPPIIVSRETTFITEPLRADGLPDYEKYVLDLYRNGITPENNAAAPLWQAFWPDELDPEDSAIMAKELGLAQIPSADMVLRDVHSDENRKRFAAWLYEHGLLALPGQRVSDAAIQQVLKMAPSQMSDEADALLDYVDRVIAEVSSRPWNAEQLPPLAPWVTENQAPLDLMVAASRRSRYYSPLSSLLNGIPDLLRDVLSPGTESAKEVARSLPVRAMWHLGSGRATDAWQDLFAMHRLCHIMANESVLHDQLVSFSVNFIACASTLTLLDQGQLTSEQARQVQRHLESLPEFAILARYLDFSERLVSLDLFVRLASAGRLPPPTHLDDEEVVPGFPGQSVISVDWNVVLRETNAWYDRLAAAARIPDQRQRSAMLAQHESDVRRMETSLQSPVTVIASAFNRQHRSKVVAAIMLSQWLPQFQAIATMQDRANVNLELARLAAALAVYRSQHGVYPSKLDDLVPGIVERLPDDLYNAKPFIYTRTDDGYLLYSVGENGQDEGGSNEQLEILAGREPGYSDDPATEKLRQQIPPGADDIAIRVPRPDFVLPKLAPSSGQP